MESFVAMSISLRMSSLLKCGSWAHWARNVRRGSGSAVWPRAAMTIPGTSLARPRAGWYRVAEGAVGGHPDVANRLLGEAARHFLTFLPRAAERGVASLAG